VDLLDGDATSLVLLSLGHGDIEDAVLEAGGDTFLLDATGKAEAARELANASFGEPVFGLVDGLLGVLSGNLLLVGRCVGLVLGLGLIFNSGLVRVATLSLLAFGDGAAHRSVLEVAAGRGSGSIGALDLATDVHGLRVGELDIDVLLGHARQLAMELISVVCFANVKLGLPCWETGASSLALTRVVVEFVKKTEERSERGVRGGSVVVEGSWKEGHCACLVGGGFESGCLLDGSWNSSSEELFGRLHKAW
jgi:hypothetical protein